MLSSVEFIALLKSHLQQNRMQIRIRNYETSPSARNSVYVNFINLPEAIAGTSGAEAENNRMSFWIEGFGRNLPMKDGMVKVQMHNSALPREYRLRAKTATPEKIAQYLADFLNKVVKEVPPNYTHTKI